MAPKKKTPSAIELNLSDLIHQIRDELAASAEKREKDGKAPIFQLDEMELEIHFGVTREAGANGKIKFSVLSLAEGEIGGDGKVQSEQIQTVRLKFKTPDLNLVNEDSDDEDISNNGNNNGKTSLLQRLIPPIFPILKS